MRKATALIFVNPLLALVLLVQAGSGMDLSWTLLVPYPTMVLIHKISGTALLVLGLVHLGLNWNWVTAQLRRRRAS
jgi:hypothetical protein